MPRYTHDFRLQMIRAVREGATVADVAKKYAVSESSVRRWCTERYRQATKHPRDCMCFTCFRSKY